MGKAVRCVNTSPGNATTRTVKTVSSGGRTAEESPHTRASISTGENDHDVDEDDSVASDDMSDMGEEWDLLAAAMPAVSLLEGGCGTAEPFAGRAQEQPSAI